MRLTNNPLVIVEEVKRKNAQCIVIDGADGSGKSTLADVITEKLRLIHINLDDYLEKKRGSFLEYIKYDLLKKVIEDANSPIIIEGVCVLAIAKTLQVKYDLHIYVKRMSHHGFWNDSELYDVDDNVDVDVDAFIAKQNAELRKLCEVMPQIEGKEFDPEDANIPKLIEELIRYHYEFKPHKIADIIYERVG